MPHRASCGLCGHAFVSDAEFQNVFCPDCPSGGMRGVLNSEPDRENVIISYIEYEALVKDRDKWKFVASTLEHGLNQVRIRLACGQPESAMDCIGIALCDALLGPKKEDC